MPNSNGRVAKKPTSSTFDKIRYLPHQLPPMVVDGFQEPVNPFFLPLPP